MKKLASLLLLLPTLSFAGQHKKVVGIDPTLTWTAPTTDCTGAAFPTGATLTYNVYIVSGPGPIPTVATSSSVPCGIISLASGSPVNASPITGTTYNTTLGNGQYTAGVEAVLNGVRGPLTQATFTVSLSPKAAASLNVGP